MRRRTTPTMLAALIPVAVVVAAVLGAPGRDLPHALALLVVPAVVAVVLLLAVAGLLTALRRHRRECAVRRIGALHRRVRTAR